MSRCQGWGLDVNKAQPCAAVASILHLFSQVGLQTPSPHPTRPDKQRSGCSKDTVEKQRRSSTGQTLPFALLWAEEPQDPLQSFLSSLWPVSISAFIATTISRANSRQLPVPKARVRAGNWNILTKLFKKLSFLPSQCLLLGAVTNNLVHKLIPAGKAQGGNTVFCVLEFFTGP